jgi:DNA-binding SARP family transcriptional activator
MQYRVLGSIEIENRCGAPLTLCGARQRALLAIFLLHANQLVSPDRLIDELWERPPRSATAALQNHVSRLRKVLHGNGEQVLLTRPNGYLLQIDHGDLDIDQFEDLVAGGQQAARSGKVEVAAATLRRALSLWRGRPFEGIEYEPFVQAEIARLEERRLMVLEARLSADLALGRHDDLVAELQALVLAHPYREEIRRQLMLALYRSGRQAESLSTYHDARRTLIGDLGIEPGPALRRLEQAILRQDSALELPDHASGSTLAQRRTRDRRRRIWSCKRPGRDGSTMKSSRSRSAGGRA